MKMTKRILSLVLVLTMLICQSVTAFADGTTATINIKVEGTIVNTIDGESGLKLYDVLESKEDEIGTVDWIEVSDWQDASIKYKALTAIDGVESAPGTATDVMAKTSYTGITEEVNAVADHPGYYQIFDTTDGTYHYVYVGYDWTYSSTLHDYIDVYMCCYTLTAGETITISYDLTCADWTQASPIE